MSTQDTGVQQFRSIILLGRNSASFKFALGKVLLSLAREEKSFVSLEDLALPFALHIVDHLKRSDKQTTSNGSRFLDACRAYGRDEISEEKLTETTLRLGFANVIDAFHNVNGAPVPTRFYVDERRERGGLVLTDDLLTIAQTEDFPSLEPEVEARWRLVETAWGLEIPVKRVGAGYDSLREEIFVTGRQARRVNVTKFRNALNGYQRGRCFYCNATVSVVAGQVDLADVDHYFPRMLMIKMPAVFRSESDGALSSPLPNTSSNSNTEGVNIDGIWNLVLSCRECNRGVGGKFAQVPQVKFLGRLFARNEYLIRSHLPLRETLLSQLGRTSAARRDFLNWMDRNAIETMVQRWRSPPLNAAGVDSF